MRPGNGGRGSKHVPRSEATKQRRLGGGQAEWQKQSQQPRQEELCSFKGRDQRCLQCPSPSPQDDSGSLPACGWWRDEAAFWWLSQQFIYLEATCARPCTKPFEWFLSVLNLYLPFPAGNMVEWCLPQDIDLEGVEFKSMASGSHKIQSDFM